VSNEGQTDNRQPPPADSRNVYGVEHRVTAEERAAANSHRGAILWFTGLSGSGKTTLALELERRLFLAGHQSFVLDGDNVRQGLNADLGFGPDDRHENIRRVGAVAGLFAEAGLIAITAFISPYRADRDRVRLRHGVQFHEIHLAAPLAICEARDTKGLYARARRGELADFTGVSAPYEPPAQPEMTLETGQQSVDWCIARLLHYVERNLRVKCSA
jgi:bifunctional enzyme CysN/CysC